MKAFYSNQLRVLSCLRSFHTHTPNSKLQFDPDFSLNVLHNFPYMPSFLPTTILFLFFAYMSKTFLDPSRSLSLSLALFHLRFLLMIVAAPHLCV